MKNVALILAAAALGLSLPALARGDYEAGKAKSAMCAGCHGARGVSTVSTFPKLAGQHPDYLLHALKAYKSGQRKNPTMQAMVQTLSEQDMENLATYFSEQKDDALYVKY
jgi:cytochrome c553